jgi:hypothetical protein
MHGTNVKIINHECFFTDLPSNVSPMHVQHGTSQLLVFRYCICKQAEHSCPMIILPLADHAQGLYLFVPKFSDFFTDLTSQAWREGTKYNDIQTSQRKIEVHELSHEICKFASFIIISCSLYFLDLFPK